MPLAALITVFGMNTCDTVASSVVTTLGRLVDSLCTSVYQARWEPCTTGSTTNRWDTFNDCSWTGRRLVQALCWIIVTFDPAWVHSLVWNISRIPLQQLCCIFEIIMCGRSLDSANYNNRLRILPIVCLIGEFFASMDIHIESYV